MGNTVSGTAEGIIKLAAATAVTIGNTVGQFIQFKCDKCKTKSAIARYSGNVVTGGIKCPNCG